MRHPRIIIAGIGLAALAAGGGITAASAGASTAGGTPAASAGAGTAIVRPARAAVGGTTETILVNRGGLPLYYYRPDTAARSFVTGGLARLWPPLTSAAPTGAGLSGRLTVLKDAVGQQVAYNGHPLYTFVDDRGGQVTGQGVQGFLVATPGLASLSGHAAAGTVPSAATGRGYGY
jgi:predicted lipoprotein with Yx(FWY)xxD motif